MGERLQVFPVALVVHLKPRELRLIIHLRAARHPIAQVHIRQPKVFRDLDMIENDIGAERVPVEIRVKERVNKAQPVIEDICQTNSAQLVCLGIGIFDQP